MFSIIQDLSVLVSIAVFVAAVALFLFGSLVFLPALQTRKLVAQSLMAEGIADRRSLVGQEQLARIAAQRPVDAYFKSIEKERDQPSALDAKLFRA
ncbi:MAG: type II secretion system F family protein, partial [Mesorhizobium sp.]